MTAVPKPLPEIDAGNATYRVSASGGQVRIHVTVNGCGPINDRTLVCPALGPRQGMLLAKSLVDASSVAFQPSLPFPGQSKAGRRRFSAADLAEMRRLRSSGTKLKDIAERFHCAVSTVAYQTADIIDPATNNARRRSQEALEMIVEMHAAGVPVRDIAEHYQCSESGVRAVLRRSRRDPSKPAQRPLVNQIPLPFGPRLVPKD